MLLKSVLVLFLILGLTNAQSSQAQGKHFGCTQDNTLFGSLPSGDETWNFEAAQNSLFASPIPWPTSDGSSMIQFAAKKLTSAGNPTDQRLIVQIGLSAVPRNEASDTNGSLIYAKPFDVSPSIANIKDASSGLINCYIDRSDKNPCKAGSGNPRCCYGNNLKSIHRDMSSLYPSCQQHSCQDLKLISGDGHPTAFGCRAICSYDAILQVEFSDNNPSTGGGEISLSLVTRRVSLVQNDGHFMEIDSNLGDAYFKIKSEHFGSTISDQEVSAFWIKWSKPSQADKIAGPTLEIGRDGDENPLFIHRFDQVCFDCNTQDQHGWHGLDVQLPAARKVFYPKFWNVNAVKGNRVQIYSNCSNIIHSAAQNQTWIGGACINTEQCQRWCPEPGCSAIRCLPFNGHKTLSWTKKRTCRIVPNPVLPLELAILFVLVAILLVLMIIFLGCMAYNIGSQHKRKAQAKDREYSVNEDDANDTTNQGLDNSVQT